MNARTHERTHRHTDTQTRTHTQRHAHTHAHAHARARTRSHALTHARTYARTLVPPGGFNVGRIQRRHLGASLGIWNLARVGCAGGWTRRTWQCLGTRRQSTGWEPGSLAGFEEAAAALLVVTAHRRARGMPPKRPPPGSCRFESDCPAFHRCVKPLNDRNGRCVSEGTNEPHHGMITHDHPFDPRHDVYTPPPPTVVTVVPRPS